MGSKAHPFTAKYLKNHETRETLHHQVQLCVSRIGFEDLGNVHLRVALQLKHLGEKYF